MSSPFDTIVAPVTATGGAIGVVRLSGPDAWRIAFGSFSSVPKEPTSHHSFYGKFSNGDDGLLLLFAEGHSYTGDESAELSVHGSPASVRSLMEDLIAKGARLARPGEFTERAFLNGKLDLTQAEAVNDTVRAASSRQLSAANAARSGELTSALDPIEARLVGHLAAIEASVDFSEEIGEIDPVPMVASLEEISDKLQVLVDKATNGRILREGLRIAIVGPPNAGKSSLLNRILGTNRAIVTPVAGTTRDYVEESIEVGGLQCVLIDTAGLRETVDEAESMGIQRSRSQAAQADLIWYVTDATDTGSHLEIEKWDKPCWFIQNKVDLLAAVPSPSVNTYYVSTYTNAGIPELLSAVASIPGDISGAIPNQRHLASLELCHEAVLATIDGLKLGHPADLVVTHLRTALFELGQITGSTASANLLDRIFADFCIGK